MGNINYFLLIGASLMFAGIVFGASSSRFGIPFLLVFLLVGMIAGEDGIGGIKFQDYQLSFLVGNLALAIILLDGGLRTKMETFRVALKPSLSLATFGVFATAALVGAFAAWILNIDWRLGLLLGTIVGSTDAAAVFSLLKGSGTRLNDRISSTLEIESGINDPMAIFLTIVLIDVLMKAEGLSAYSLLLLLAQQFSLGCGLGVGFGYLLSELFKRVRIGEGLHALLLCSGGVTIFSVTNLAGGSGFLAVYLVGLVVGNRRHHIAEGILRAMDGMAWLAQSGMFLLLGLLVTPREVLEIAGPAIAIALFLMLVARPVAVALGLLPFRFKAKEVVFISWVGLRGAVPIVMAMFPLLAGLEDARLIFNVAFMVVLASLLFQGTSIPIAARLLGIGMPGRAEPISRMQLKGGRDRVFEVVQFSIPSQSDVAGVAPLKLTLPADCNIATILRHGVPMHPADVSGLEQNDVVTVIAPATAVDRLAELFHRRHKPGSTIREFYGDFMLDGDAMLSEIVELYGGTASHDVPKGISLSEAIPARLRRNPVEGDAVELCGLQFTVRSMEGSRIVKVGMKLPRDKMGQAYLMRE
jgi:cell volume regulation protein A